MTTNCIDGTLTGARIRRYDRPGPRYTSYPTAAEFHAGVTPRVYDSHLRRTAAS